MKRVLLILLAALLLTGCSAPEAQERKEAAYRQVSTQEAVDMMAREKDYIILDVRTQAEYAAAHIPGAICVPNETIGQEAVAELPDKNQLILVYCRSGNRSKQASAKLAGQGYTNIVEFGGINAWTGETVNGDQP